MSKTKKDCLNIGLLGLGTVGGGVAKILSENAANIKQRCGLALKPHTAVVRNAGKAREGIPDTLKLTTDAEALVTHPEIDIIVETMGGVDPAKQLIERALSEGKHVVSSNKELIAKHGIEFIKLAKENAVNLYFEGAVAGGIPIIQALQQSLAANNIKEVVGIMNGTTNFILSKMHADGADFQDVLKEAQALGFAEADPTDDVDGYDVAYKLAILASIAFNSHFTYEDIHFEGIRKISAADIEAAQKMNHVIKLVAVGIDHGEAGVELRVHPVMIDATHPISGVNGCFNAVFVEGNYVGETMFYGPGAGSLPTASAVTGDIINIAMQHQLPESHPCIDTHFTSKKVIPVDACTSEYYIRLEVVDEPGVLASIAHACGEAAVSIKSVEQKEPVKGKAELILITHEVEHGSVLKAVKSIDQLNCIANIHTLIRVGL